jgi:hypothetical protein
MLRRRFNQTRPLEERLGEEAKRLRAKAKLLPPGAKREALLRRAREAETGSHMSEWLSSPGRQPPTPAESLKPFVSEVIMARKLAPQDESKDKRSSTGA